MFVAEDVCISINVVKIDGYRDFLRQATWPVLEAVPFINRQCHGRDGRLATRGGPDHYLLQVLTSDALPDDFNEADVPAAIGDICLFDLARFPEHQFATRPALSIAIPRQILEKAFGSRSLHGLIVKAHWPMTPLIAGYLRSLCVLKTQLPDLQAIAAQEAVALLLAAALKSDVPADSHAAPPLGAWPHQTIVDFITRNLYLQELSPEFLCRRFNVSRAHLYRAFAADGGVAKVLRDMRLDAAYGELTRAGHAPRSITEIAYSLCFSSANQLLRSFRARFGITPSEARAYACVLGRSQVTDL